MRFQVFCEVWPSPEKEIFLLGICHISDLCIFSVVLPNTQSQTCVLCKHVLQVCICSRIVSVQADVDNHFSTFVQNKTCQHGQAITAFLDCIVSTQFLQDQNVKMHFWFDCIILTRHNCEVCQPIILFSVSSNDTLTLAYLIHNIALATSVLASHKFSIKLTSL